MSELLGQQLGNYTLTRVLHRETFTESYLGEHVRMKAIARIVVLRANLTEEQITPFQETVQRIAGLIHPHIVRTLDGDLYHGTPFLVQAYVPASLRQLYPEGTQLPLDTVVAYVKQAASALHYAHEQGITHGDLRPEQMLQRERDKSLLVTGFGLATLLSLVFPDFVPDNPYLALELPQQAPQPASDQYSLAKIAHELLGGASSKLPQEVEQVLTTAQAIDPGQRFATIQAFATALEQASKIGQVQPVQPLARPAPIAAASVAAAVSDAGELSPAPPTSAPEHALHSAQTEPEVLAQIPARRGVSRRWLLTGLGLGGAAIVAGIGGSIFLKQQPDMKAFVSSPPKLIYTYQSQALFSGGGGFHDFDLFWSPDGKQITTVDHSSSTVQVWDAADGNHLITWTAPKKSLYTLQWAQGRLLVAWSLGKGDYEREERVHVRDVISGQDMTTYTGHVSASPGFGIRYIAFSPDGKRIASLKDGYTSSDAYLVHIWDAQTAATIASLAVDGRAVALYWAPDGKHLLSWSSDTNLHVWDAQTGASIATTASQKLSIAPAWSPNNRYIASTEWNSGLINVWDAQTGQRVCSYLHEAGKDVYAFVWSPDSSKIASAGQGDDSVHVWNAATGKRIAIHGDWLFTPIAWSPDGKHIASSGAANVRCLHSFEVWDAANGTTAVSYNTPPSDIPDVVKIAWSPDGQYIAAVDRGDSNNNAIYVWKVGWGQGAQQTPSV